LLLECPGSLPTIVEFCVNNSFALGPAAGDNWVAQALGCCVHEHLGAFVMLAGTLSRLAESQDEEDLALTDISSSSDNDE
jgi:hypothetical protein